MDFLTASGRVEKRVEGTGTRRGVVRREKTVRVLIKGKAVNLKGAGIQPSWTVWVSVFTVLVASIAGRKTAIRDR